MGLRQLLERILGPASPSVPAGGQVAGLTASNLGQPLEPADNSITTQKLANGALSADLAGRAKMADLYVTLAKLAAGIMPTPVLARGQTTSVTAGAVIVSLSATTGYHLHGIHYTADPASSSPVRAVFTYTDDTTETLETTGVGATPSYMGGRSGLININNNQVALALAANAAKKVKKVELHVGAAAGAGTKVGVIAAMEVLAA